MGTINQSYFDRVRYTLYNDVFGSVIITEPVGWHEDDKEWARDETYHGVISKFSNNLKFIGDAANFIKMVKVTLGVKAILRLTKDVKNSKTDEWDRSYDGYLDMYTYEWENNQVSIKFNSAGLEQILKTRASDQIEIDRTTSIDGSEIDELNTINVKIDGRRIFLKTKYTVKESENSVKMVDTTNGNTRGSNYPVPIVLVNKSHEESQSPIPATQKGDDSWDRSGNGENGLMFFAISERRRLLDINMNIVFTSKFEETPSVIVPGAMVLTGFDDINDFRFWCRLAHYENGSNYNLKENHILYTSNNFHDIHNETRSLNFSGTIELMPGDSLSLEFCQNMDGANGHDARLATELSNVKCDLTVEEDSYFDPTTTKAVLAYELANRLIEVYTGKSDLLYSEFLGRKDIGYPSDGTGAFTGITHGFWLRGYDKLPIPSEGPPPVENLFKPLTTSLNDMMMSLEAVWNVGMGIERVGLKERVRIEDKRFFFNRNTTIKLPNQIKKVKRYYAANYLYSSLEFGYEKGGDYEEACGLDEYNVKTNFTTCLNRKEPYSKVSKYRADKYGAEFCRRKQKSLNDTIDTPYDLDNFLMDLKRDEFGNYQERKWQDDFLQAPKGIFSPETATNLRYSPFNCLLRHSWWFSGGLELYPNEYLSYASSLGNSRMSTKMNIYNKEYSENGRLLNSELPRGLFEFEWVEFEHECDDDILKMVEGHTIIQGKRIPNFYGLVEYKNEEGNIEKGFLFNLKPNGTGKWKVLKFNR